jgi:hypothetical protein
MAHVRRHRIPEQLEALVDAYQELGRNTQGAVQRLLPFLDRYGVRLAHTEPPGGRAISDGHQQYTLRAEVATALAIVTGAARAVGDDGLVETCCSLAAAHHAWRKAS